MTIAAWCLGGWVFPGRGAAASPIETPSITRAAARGTYRMVGFNKSDLQKYCNRYYLFATAPRFGPCFDVAAAFPARNESSRCTVSLVPPRPSNDDASR